MKVTKRCEGRTPVSALAEIIQLLTYFSVSVNDITTWAQNDINDRVASWKKIHSEFKLLQKQQRRTKQLSPEHLMTSLDEIGQALNATGKTIANMKKIVRNMTNHHQNFEFIFPYLREALLQK